MTVRSSNSFLKRLITGFRRAAQLSLTLRKDAKASAAAALAASETEGKARAPERAKAGQELTSTGRRRRHRSPDNPHTDRITVRVTPSLKERIQAYARHDERSLEKLLRHKLLEMVKRFERDMRNGVDDD